MGPFIIIIPLALAAVGLAAAASSKKKSESGSGTGPTGLPGAIPSTAPGATGATGPYATGLILAEPGWPVGVDPTARLPADIEALVTQSVSSQNPETIRRVADALEKKGWIVLAQGQREIADSMEAALGTTSAAGPIAAATTAPTVVVQAAQNAAAAATAAGATPAQAVQAAQTAAGQAAAPPLTQPPAAAIAAALAVPAQALQAAQTAAANATAAGATPAQAILAAQNAAVMTATPGVNAAVQQAAQSVQTAVATGTLPRPQAATVPMPTVQPQSAPANSAKALAADMAKALLTAKKGTASEPRALVQAFQTQERLEQTDGSYGYETAIALADRYGIVPPKPLYWGKKGGPASLPAQQKASYSAHLMVLKSQDPQRADEWAAAAKV